MKNYYNQNLLKKNQPEIRKKKDPKIFTRDDFSMNLVLKKCLNKAFWLLKPLFLVVKSSVAIISQL